MASRFATGNPSPHMELPPSLGARTGAALAGASGAKVAAEEAVIGDVEAVLGARPHKASIKLGSNWR